MEISLVFDEVSVLRGSEEYVCHNWGENRGVAGSGCWGAEDLSEPTVKAPCSALPLEGRNGCEERHTPLDKPPHSKARRKWSMDSLEPL